MKYLLILIPIFIFGCKTKEKETVQPHREADEIVMNFELVETVKGISNFRLKANKALSYKDRTVVYGVTLVFYKGGAPYATLASDSGVLFIPSNDMEAMGNVKVVGIDGTVLETEMIKWVNAINKIMTEDKVIITTKENKKIEGRCFESDPGLSHIKLKETYGYGD
ncbi:MAG: LPS export ABC transporter periplasmic protein LptC [bacterium]|nr:LPS export ABC transporter periplasmic protein LptC [bacterium]